MDDSEKEKAMNDEVYKILHINVTHNHSFLDDIQKKNKKFVLNLLDDPVLLSSIE